MSAPRAWAASWQDPGNVAASFAGGSGTAGAPYQIATPQQLAYMADRINNDNATYGNKYYILTSNVDLSGNDWEPILSFQGNFDGRGRTISNTMFTGGTNIGFFKDLLATAIISNLCMTGVNISGTAGIGGLANGNWGTVTNCIVSGSITGAGNNVALLIAHNFASVTNCVALGTINGPGNNKGGLIGATDTSGSVSNCSVNCYVNGTNGIGALIGGNYGTLSNCIASGNLIGTGLYRGGLVGSTYTAVSSSVASTRVTGTSSSIAGLVGENPYGSVASSVFDSQGTTRSTGIGTGTGTAVAKNTAAMTSGANPGTLAGSWVFTPGYYPQPSGLANNTSAAGDLIKAVSALHAVPVFLSGGELANGVTQSFKVPKLTAIGKDIEWSSAASNVTFYHQTGDEDYWHVGWSSAGTVDLIAKEEHGFEKRFNLTVSSSAAPAFTSVGPNTHRNVTFDPQGGSPVNSARVPWGGKITTPANPTRTGYTFGGWYKEAACTNAWNFATDTVTANITLYARWMSPAAVPTGVSATIDSVTYPLTLDGSAWGVTLPQGVSNSAVTISVTLPTGATMSPSLSGVIDFSSGAVPFTVTAADGVTTETFSIEVNRYTSAIPGVNQVGAVKIGAFPLTLAPGDSFEVGVTFETDDGLPPNPAPAISAPLDIVTNELVSVDILSPSRIAVTALPRVRASARSAPQNSAIYGQAQIMILATQTLPDGTELLASATKSLVIGDGMNTPVAIGDDLTDEFQNANDELSVDEVTVLPGGTQPGIRERSDWHVVDRLDDGTVSVVNPDPYDLPECFETSGKRAADIMIDLSSQRQPGRKCLVPMTYRAVTASWDLDALFGAETAARILASPLDHLDEIFDKMVIQKLIRQGERTGWYTRLVDGVLKPRDALDAGILEITGGDELVMVLSYYVLDDALPEAFVYDGYLIIPDGENDGWLADPVWLNWWTDGYVPGGNSYGNSIGGAGGGGCGVGSAALAAICMAAAVFLALPSVLAIRRRERHVK